MNTQQISVVQKLPVIPLMMHPLVGVGIVERRLMFNVDYLDAETAMAAMRDTYAPERAPFHRAYFTERTRDKNKVRVRYLWGREPRRTRVIGITDASPEAVRILIGNNLAGYYMGHGIRWELYEDRDCENLMELGRLDQWDLLHGIAPAQLNALAEKASARQEIGTSVSCCGTEAVPCAARTLPSIVIYITLTVPCASIAAIGRFSRRVCTGCLMILHSLTVILTRWNGSLRTPFSGCRMFSPLLARCGSTTKMRADNGYSPSLKSRSFGGRPTETQRIRFARLLKRTPQSTLRCTRARAPCSAERWLEKCRLRKSTKLRPTLSRKRQNLSAYASYQQGKISTLGH